MIDIATKLLNSKSPAAKSELSDTPHDESLYPSEKFLGIGKERVLKINKDNIT